MAQTVTVTFNTPTGKGTPSKTPDLIEVGDTLTLTVKGGDGVEDDQAVTVTYVSNDGRTVGWDRMVTDVRPEDVKGRHYDHNRENIFCS